MRAVGKRFGATVALDGVDIDLRRGEVHALIGENGAGKSTLMKVLSGAIRPDAGTVTLDGAPFTPAGPAAARERGVAMIYQELALAPHLTVEANIALGIERSTGGVIHAPAMRRRAREALARLDHADMPLHKPVQSLSPASRQIVEIARALVADARLVVMDEPTSSLGLEDIKRLFSIVRSLASQDVGVVYISHFLEEVLEVADRYTVLRDGRVAGSGPVGQTGARLLVEMMIGRRLEEMFPRVEHEIGTPVLKVDALVSRASRTPNSLSVRRGEIMGIAGLVGAGRTELLRALFGLDRAQAGTASIERHGKWMRLGIGPGGRLRRGIGAAQRGPRDRGPRARPLHRREPHAGRARRRLGARLDQPIARTRRDSALARSARDQGPRPRSAGRLALRREPAEGRHRTPALPRRRRPAPG
jgi:ribose transport system ATP-binding protein